MSVRERGDGTRAVRCGRACMVQDASHRIAAHGGYRSPFPGLFGERVALQQQEREGQCNAVAGMMGMWDDGGKRLLEASGLSSVVVVVDLPDRQNSWQDSSIRAYGTLCRFHWGRTFQVFLAEWIG